MGPKPVKNGVKTRPPNGGGKKRPTYWDVFFKPATRWMARTGITPNGLTLFGTGLTFLSTLALAKGFLFWAGFWLLIAGLFDVLDGNLARNEGMASRFGAFFDSVMDRVSEAAVFAGLLIRYFNLGRLDGCLLVFTVFLLSLLVPYARARAEGLGLECKVGVLPRPGRVLLLAAGFILGQPAAVLAVVGVLSAVTLAQRVGLVWRATKVL